MNLKTWMMYLKNEYYDCCLSILEKIWNLWFKFKKIIPKGANTDHRRQEDKIQMLISQCFLKTQFSTRNYSNFPKFVCTTLIKPNTFSNTLLSTTFCSKRNNYLDAKLTFLAFNIFNVSIKHANLPYTINQQFANYFSCSGSKVNIKFVL